MLTSGSEGDLGVASGPSFVSDLFEFILPLPVAAGVAVLEAAVSVSMWAAWADFALSGKSGYTIPSVRTVVENAGASR